MRIIALCPHCCRSTNSTQTVVLCPQSKQSAAHCCTKRAHAGRRVEREPQEPATHFQLVQLLWMLKLGSKCTQQTTPLLPCTHAAILTVCSPLIPCTPTLEPTKLQCASPLPAQNLTFPTIPQALAIHAVACELDYAPLAVSSVTVGHTHTASLLTDLPPATNALRSPHSS